MTYLVEIRYITPEGDKKFVIVPASEEDATLTELQAAGNEITWVIAR